MSAHHQRVLLCLIVGAKVNQPLPPHPFVVSASICTLGRSLRLCIHGRVARTGDWSVPPTTVLPQALAQVGRPTPV
jgi:hypothetical protein